MRPAAAALQDGQVRVGGQGGGVHVSRELHSTITNTKPSLAAPGAWPPPASTPPSQPPATAPPSALTVEHHGLDVLVDGGGGPLHDVRGQRPGAAHKAQRGGLAANLLPDEPQALPHKAELV